MAKNLVYVGVIVLAVIAIVLGYKIYQQTLANKTVSTTEQPQSKTKPQPTSRQITIPATPQTQQPSAAEVAEVLKFPGPNATEVERKKHSDLVNKLGNQFGGATFLDISGCNPNPVVYRVKQGSSFKVKNSDQIEHTIYTDPIRQTKISANSEQTVESKNIGVNNGDYGYNCDSSTNPAGIIQIVPQ